MLLRILAAASFLTLANGLYVCPTAPQNLTSQITSNDDSLPPNMNCNFTFTFNNPTFALMNISVWSIGTRDLVQVIGSFDIIRSNNNSWFMFNNKAFPSSQVTINVQTGNDTKMVMSFGLLPMTVIPTYQSAEDQSLRVSTRNGDVYNVGYVRLDLSENATIAGSAWSISADNTVSVIASSPPGIDVLNFLNLFVLDENLQPIGSLHSMHNTLFSSKSNNVTVYYASSFDNGFQGTILLNDKQNLASCKSYKTQWSYGNPSYRTTLPEIGAVYIDTTIDASNGTACLTILNDVFNSTNSYNWPTIQVQLVTEIFSNNGSYATTFVTGTPMDDMTGFILGTQGDPATGYNPSDLWFPQFFDGSIRTIIVENRIQELQTTVNYTDRYIIFADFKQRGFVATNNYPRMSALQITSQPLILERKNYSMFTFTFYVNYTDVDQYSEEQIVVTTFVNNWNVIRIPLFGKAGKTFSFDARAINLSIESGSQWSPNIGTFLSYWISEPQPVTSTTSPLPSTTPTQTMSTSTSTATTTTTFSSTNGANVTLPTTNVTAMPISTSTTAMNTNTIPQTTGAVIGTNAVTTVALPVETTTKLAFGSAVMVTFIASIGICLS